MRRQMGMTLMIIGVFCFIVGFVFYSSPKKTAEPINQRHQDNERVSSSTSLDEETLSSPPAVEPSPTPIAEPRDSPNPIKTAPAPSSSDELDKIINMAIVDGVLTPNERNLIKDFTNSRGLDYNAVIQDVEKRIAAAGVAETEMVDINKKKGDDFEKFVVQKFDRSFFTIKEWAGDKYVNGRYAQTTQHPDLLIEFKMKGQTTDFAVECKWKSNFYKGGIEFATPEQLMRYQSFESRKKIPVFIAIGVSGMGSNPEELFIVPLKEIDSNFIPLKTLNKYKKYMKKNFYFDNETMELK